MYVCMYVCMYVYTIMQVQDQHSQASLQASGYLPRKFCAATGPFEQSFPLRTYAGHSPDGPSTQYLRSQSPNTISSMVLGARSLKYWVLGPSGFRTRARAAVEDHQTLERILPNHLCRLPSKLI